jgi:hypothetical protein
LGYGAATAAGCQNHNCDPAFVCIDPNGLRTFVDQAADCTPTTQGDTPIPGYTTDVSVNGNVVTWATSAFDGPWLDYPGQRTYIINFPKGFAGYPLTSPPQVQIAIDNPDAGEPHQFITGVAYLAEFSNDSPQQITVLNPSCAGYFLRVEFQAEIPSDAGSDGDEFAVTDAGSAD